MSQSNHLHTMDTFTRFFQENQAKFLSFAYSYIRNKTEAEDILMESMIALWENRDKWENTNHYQKQGFKLSRTRTSTSACGRRHQHPPAKRTELTHIYP